LSGLAYRLLAEVKDTIIKRGVFRKASLLVDKNPAATFPPYEDQLLLMDLGMLKEPTPCFQQ
jgi:hypothetical protein